MDLGRLIIIAVLVSIVAFLGSALFQLARSGNWSCAQFSHSDSCQRSGFREIKSRGASTLRRYEVR
jgi:hypothetical protein